MRKTRKRGVFALISAFFLLASLIVTPAANAYYSYEGSGTCSGGNDAYNDYVCLYDGSTPGSGIFFRFEIGFSSKEEKLPDLRSYPFSGSGGGSWNDRVSSYSWKTNGIRGTSGPYGNEGGVEYSFYQLTLSTYQNINYGGSKASVTTLPGSLNETIPSNSVSSFILSETYNYGPLS
ncbi:hypothetical protein [Lentzea sp. NEAU-D7]|uniref:hypothetical protein n=1 Tax=Lentzea sp. NEAU-D7 TaxID=2994667 RepID=UPI00224A6CD4|nr:hypothetical protein [Lentzea sp. NEAU-D7]MCX2952819.1 hypothetical protein [Lentzea sp. NEAU-D7]